MRYHIGGVTIGCQRDKLIEKARASPASLTFDEAIRLAGFGGLRFVQMLAKLDAYGLLD